jgi:hypothetical protein
MPAAKQEIHMYQGHMPDGSSIQRHSAGGIYPYVVFVKSTNGVSQYGVLEPAGEESLFNSYTGAVQFAAALKALDSFCSH